MADLPKSLRHFFRVILHNELNNVGNALLGWLPSRPQFKIVYPIVASYPVPVVNGFVLKKWPLKEFRHD